MKKNLLILATVISVLFSNCKKGAVSSSNDTTTIAVPAEYVVTAQNTLNVQSLKGLPDQDLKRIAYGLLLPIEKYLVWVDNVNTLSKSFTPQQKLLVIEFIGFLSPQLFDNPDRGKAASFRDKWLDKAQKIFTNDQIRAIAYQLFSTTDTKSQVAINSAAGEVSSKKPCNCHGGATLTCDGVSYCPTDFAHGECKDPSNWGCGFSGLWSCDNLCVYSNGTTTEPSN